MKKLILVCVALLLIACKAPSDNIVTEDTDISPVDEKSYITLGGEEQYVEISSSDDKNPVMLFIHGGPGWPQTPQIRAFNSDISKRYTMVVWEQRGAGLSYKKNPNPKNVSLRQIVADAQELTDQLKTRFKQEKIYLAGYSWGSIVGMELAKQYPDDYHAYISIAQIVNMKRGMEISQEWLRKKAAEKDDQETLKTLDILKDPPADFCVADFDCFVKQYALIGKYNGAAFDPNIDKIIAEKTAKYEDYKDYDWFKVWEESVVHLKEDMGKVDYRELKELSIPVYFFIGRHDYNIPAVLVEEFAKDLKAPKKEVIWMEKSGHGIMEEEAETFNKLVVDKVLGPKSNE